MRSKGLSGAVALKDEARARRVEAVKVGRETTSWTELSEGPLVDIGRPSERRETARSPGQAPAAALRMISVKGRGPGAVEGFGLGALTGGAVGLAVGARGSGRTESAGVITLATAALGAIAGILLGTVTGAAIGHRTTVGFETEAQAAARQALPLGKRR